MGKDSPLQIRWLDEVDSTQRYLLDALRSNRLLAPIAVTATRQSAGQGSRGNGWQGIEGNLFVSFALKRTSLPVDLRLESCSLYFSYLLKETLSDKGSNVWLKWPNDLYLEDKKIGGVVTNLVGDDLVCGIGLNLLFAPIGFGVLDINIERQMLLEDYFSKLEESISWKQIFSKYALEFGRNRDVFTHNNEKKISLKDAKLLHDGSIECDGERMFSLR